MYESKGFWHFSLVLKRCLSNEKIQYLYCTLSCTVSTDDRTIKIMLFHQSAPQAIKKHVIVTHFTTKIICTYLYIACNKKILFVNKYFSLWVYTNSSILLFCFLNTNTAVTRKLIWTARTLEAEWWQVCGEVWVWGQRKMGQVLGAFGLLDFTMLLPVLDWRMFLNLMNRLFLWYFQIFLRAVANCGPPVYCFEFYVIWFICICMYVCVYVYINKSPPPEGSA